MQSIMFFPRTHLIRNISTKYFLLPHHSRTLWQSLYSTEAEAKTSWESLGVSPEFTQLLEKNGYHEPFDIQQKVIPKINEGNNLLFTASTGSGKTLAYLVPLLQRLYNDQKYQKAVKLIIFIPGKPLLYQIHQVIQQLNLDNKFQVLHDLDIHNEDQEYTSNSPHHKILLVNPNRFLSTSQKRKKLLLTYFRQVRYFVFEEIDKLLENDYLDRFKIFIRLFQKQLRPTSNQQIIMNGATLLDELIRIKNKSTKIQYIRSKIYSLQVYYHQDTHYLPRNLDLKFIYLNQHPSFLNYHQKTAFNQSRNFDLTPHQQQQVLKEKVEQIHHIIQTYQQQLSQPQSSDFQGTPLILIFTNIQSSLETLQTELNLLFPEPDRLFCLHKGLEYKDFQKILKKMYQTKFLPSKDPAKDFKILVTTDLLTRGMDFPNCRLIIQADLAPTPIQFIHRVGRTARANCSGQVINLVDPHLVHLGKAYELACQQGNWFEPVLTTTAKNLKRRAALSILDSNSSPKPPGHS